MEKSIVYFSKTISKEKLIELYDLLGIKLEERVAVKVHSGEEGNQNFLRPDFYKSIVEHVKGTIVECNTAYDGARNTSKKHRELFNKHGWSNYYKVDLLDEDGSSELEVKNGNVLKVNYVGKNLLNYNSLLVVSHFKGHPMGGYGGALKQLSIGCASSEGKAYIHSAGKTTNQDECWDNLPKQKIFLESMADSASTVTDLFKGKCAFINVMVNLSVDCDCCSVAEDPCMKDVGILASLDPVAIDKACLDLIYKSNDPGKNHFIERVESRYGMHTIDKAQELGIGSKDYKLVEID